MFLAGEKVIYGRVEACVIREVANRNFDGTLREYYVLIPVKGNGQSVYVPTDSAVLTAKMKRVMNADEIAMLMEQIANTEMPWIDNDADRRETFERIVAAGSNAEKARLIGCIWKQKDILAAKGKRLHQKDEYVFKETSNCLHGELSLALDIPEEEVPHYIETCIARIREK